MSSSASVLEMLNELLSNWRAFLNALLMIGISWQSTSFSLWFEIESFTFFSSRLTWGPPPFCPSSFSSSSSSNSCALSSLLWLSCGFLKNLDFSQCYLYGCASITLIRLEGFPKFYNCGDILECWSNWSFCPLKNETGRHESRALDKEVQVGKHYYLMASYHPLHCSA